MIHRQLLANWLNPNKPILIGSTYDFFGLSTKQTLPQFVFIIVMLAESLFCSWYNFVEIIN